MAFDRVIEFDGCFNFRDVGGYPTVDGRWVRPQLLYRADGPHALTTRDESLLRSLGLRTVLDLRTVDESSERGSYATHVDDVIVYHLPMLDALPDTNDLTHWANPVAMAERYREMLDGAPESVAEVLAILSDPSAYPALIHCTAGKDRTGIITAVVLGVLGVADDTIVADYALSEVAMTRLHAHMRTLYPDAQERLDEIAPVMFAAHADTMRRFLTSMRADYTTFDNYAQTLDVDSAAGYLRSALLV
jgi:protein-tyrosine phosphatase